MIKKRLSFILRFSLLVLIEWLLLAYALFQGDSASWFLAYFFSFVLLFVILGCFFRLKFWKIERHFSKKSLQDGDLLSVELHISRRFYYPVGYLAFEQVLPSSLGKKAPLIQVSYPFLKKEMIVELGNFRLKRGVHKFPPLQIKTSDPFALLERRFALDHKESLTIYPRYYPGILEKLDRAAKHHKQILHTQEVGNFHGLREFIPSDHLSSVDWKTTAKTGQMMSREYEKSPEVKMTMIFYGVEHPLFEHTLRAAYSFIRKMSEQKKAIDVILFTRANQEISFSLMQQPFHKTAKIFSEIEPFSQNKIEQMTAKISKINTQIMIFTPEIRPFSSKIINHLNLSIVCFDKQKQLLPNVIVLEKAAFDLLNGGENK
ncbi:DUF58 domain-containing protein [Listeria sp. PSOL-1]|uniref:DUF58 domain-containing protein n=1 Tax=Listeria sp. PSOL-1 TaxID=1844999 RepID=UPI0013D2B642|nr:DUF58 domain-containing protein [Listeria sp. PSOL-1]